MEAKGRPSELADLECRGLWFAYEGAPPTLCGVDLRIRAGEILAIIGQNGSGKSTLAKHFNGLLRPSGGQVLLGGRDICDWPVGQIARQVGYVFQNPDHQIFAETTWQEVAFGLRCLGFGEKEIDGRTQETLERFGLGKVADLPPASLSYGLRRKITAACTYAMRPAIVILDEPTSGLDWRSAQELLAHFRVLNEQGHTLVLISHDMRLVAAHAPRCVLVEEGRVAADTQTRTLFASRELLARSRIQPPQICQLAQSLAGYGLEEDLLTVEGFCSSLGALVRRAEERRDHRG